MKTKLDFEMIGSAICVAGYAAIAMGYLAVHHLGVPRDQVRGAAIVAALLIAVTVAIDHFGRKLGNTK